MAEEHHQLEVRLRRSGIFDGRTINGFQYEDELGELAWHISTWPISGDPIEDYWVTGGEFYEIVGLHFAVNMLPLNRIEVGRLITGIDPVKRDTILNAIADWEKPTEAEAP